MALNHASHLAIRRHVSILDRVKYTSAEMDENIIKSLFGVSDYAVSVQQEDTSHQGLTPSLSAAFPNNAFVAFKPAKAGPMVPSAGYIFQKPKNLVKRWRVDERDSEAIEVGMDYSIKVVSSLSGYMITGLL
jgi:hypothetical protein